MIIKGLFRRYEKWNPVHPTSGAFWGMGIGIGCGVGWGPGFGPEVIGYVGAGCGVGFSVGITFAGFGIGLPTNYVIEAPYNAMMATGSTALGFARSSVLLPIRNNAGGSWNSIAPCISSFQREASERFSSFKHKHSSEQQANLYDMKRVISFHTKSMLECLESFSGRFSRPSKGLKD